MKTSLSPCELFSLSCSSAAPGGEAANDWLRGVLLQKAGRRSGERGLFGVGGCNDLRFM